MLVSRTICGFTNNFTDDKYYTSPLRQINYHLAHLPALDYSETCLDTWPTSRMLNQRQSAVSYCIVYV